MDPSLRSASLSESVRVHGEWTRGSPPDPAALVAAAIRERDPHIDPLVADAEERWTRGLPAGIDYYAAAAPRLLENKEACRALLMCEAARRTGVPRDELQAEFARRFPTLTAEASDVLEILALMQAGEGEAEDPMQPGARLGKYELIERLGRGGFGEVWRAEDAELHRYVALKLIPVPLVRRGKGRGTNGLIAEARAAAAIDHENVVRVHDAGVLEDLGLVFIDSQLAGDSQPRPDDPLHVDVAKPLDQLMRPGVQEAVRIMEAACRAIGAAHARAVLHRDIKPGNILLTPSGRPMVSDFGLALGTHGSPAETLSEQGRIAGTPAYMAPEQARGEAVTPLSDVYALGATLRFLLTGEAPYQPSTKYSDSARDDVLEQARRAELTPMSRAGVPRTLAAIVHKAMAPRPEDRYQTPLQMADDLLAFREHRPTLAGKPSSVHELGLFLRRHAVVASIAAAGLVLAAGIAAWSIVRIIQERDRAVVAEQQVRRQRDDAVAANQFLRGVLGRTVNSLGASDATIAQAVRDMDRIADRKLESRPLAEASIRSFLADSRFESREAGLRNAQRAWEIYRDQLGPDAPETIAARRAVLVFDRRQSAISANLPELLALHERCRRVLGENDPETLRTEVEVLTATMAADQPGVIPKCERLLEKLRAAPTPSNADIASTLDLLAAGYWGTHEYAKAADAMGEVVAMLVRTDGESQTTTLTHRQSFAGYLVSAGRRAEAAEQFRLAADGLVALAPRSAYTAFTLSNRAQFLVEEGDLAGGIADIKRAIELTRPHTERVDSMMHYMTVLGGWQLKHGDRDEGRKSLQEAISIAEAHQWTDRADILHAMELLGMSENSPPAPK